MLLKKKFAVLAVGAVLGLSVLGVAPWQQAQQAARAKGSTAAAGEDRNIKTAGPVNDRTRGAIPAPPSKGGTATRGAVGVVVFDNFTGWYINGYVDGDYCGTAGPWGSTYCYVISGNHSLYAKAPGVNITWGPSTFYVGAQFTWSLDP